MIHSLIVIALLFSVVSAADTSAVQDLHDVGQDQAIVEEKRSHFLPTGRNSLQHAQFILNMEIQRQNRVKETAKKLHMTEAQMDKNRSKLAKFVQKMFDNRKNQ